LLDLMMLFILAVGFTYRVNILTGTSNDIILGLVFIMGLTIAAVTMKILRLFIRSYFKNGVMHTKTLVPLFLSTVPLLFILVLQHWGDLIFFVLFSSCMILSLWLRDRFIRSISDR
jgi:hypothetical protein